MNSPQKEAAKIIKLAYKNGGSINLSVLKFTHNKDKIASEVTHILSAYGYMTSNAVDSNFGWEIYKLSEKGMELAKKGVFNENPENILSEITNAGSIFLSGIHYYLYHYFSY